MRRRSVVDRHKLWGKIGYSPHSAAQMEFHDSTSRFRVPICGRRFGKSFMAAVDMAEAMFIPDAYFWICGPTYKLGEKEFRIIHDIFVNKLGMGKEIKKSYNVQQGDMRLELPWKTVLEVVSATNSDSLLGEGLHGVIMSEAARHSMQTWEQYVEPALSDNMGFATFPTTPKGFNWIQGLWQLGQMPEMVDYDSWQYPTWINTVKYPIDATPDEEGVANSELQRIKSVVSPAWWHQEYGAKFTSFEGQIYDEFDSKLHVTDIPYNPAWKNYWAFDYGFKDPFICLDIMVDPSDNVYVWREYQVSYLSTWEHGHKIKNRENPPGFHVEAMFGDPRGADEAATLALILGYIWGPDLPWPTGIETIKRWLKLQPDGRPKLFIDRSCHHLIRQMQGLRHKDSKEGHNAKEGQHDYDDHGPDALRYFFGPYFVLGAGASLASVYSPSQLGSEAETFFQLKSGITLGSGFDL